MELMPSILLAVEFKATIAKREPAVCFAGCDGVGQHATHGIVALVSNDTLAEIHHPTTLGDDPASLFRIVLDGFAAGFIQRQRLQMLLRIAARQIEQVDAVEVGNIFLWVEEPLVDPIVQCLLIEE